MRKASFKTLAFVALLCAWGSAASATPQLLAGKPAPNVEAVRLAFSPVPLKLKLGMGLLQIRDPKHARGGGCWSHCLNTFNECMGLSTQEVCVSRVKTCMETCDRLSGMVNPTQRPSSPDKASLP